MSMHCTDGMRHSGPRKFYFVRDVMCWMERCLFVVSMSDRKFPTFQYSSPNLNVFDLCRINGYRVVCEYCEVGELAGFNTALLAFQSVRISCLNCDSPQRALNL